MVLAYPQLPGPKDVARTNVNMEKIGRIDMIGMQRLLLTEEGEGEGGGGMRRGEEWRVPVGLP